MDDIRVHGLCQPRPVEQGGIRLEALVCLTLGYGQEQRGRQADAVDVAHHDVALIADQPLLQLWQCQAACLSCFIPNLKPGALCP